MTRWSPRRWGAPELLAAWVAYWLLLAAAAFARPVLIMYRIRGLPEGSSNAQVSLGDQGFVAHIVSQGRTLIDQRASGTAVLLWLVVPPLLIFVAWLVMRPRRGHTRPGELGAGDPLAGFDATRRERESTRREPRR